LQALKRIDMYASPFKGWSMYEVDGMFFNGRGKVYKERTQVIRLLFRFGSSYVSKAKAYNCSDVLRSILFWTISERGLLLEEESWGIESKKRFINVHGPFSKEKMVFTERYFQSIARAAAKWIDDCALFIFGYLVGNFSRNVLDKKKKEEEIWVASFFELTLNVAHIQFTSATWGKIF